jgi:hypothetical protein
VVSLDAAVTEFLTSGLILGAASRDDRLVPEVVRPGGVRVEEGGGEVTVFVPTAAAGTMLRHLESNRRLALVATNPQDNRSVQLKGAVQEVRAAREDERLLVDQHRARLARMLEPLGVPRLVVLRMQVWPATAVRFRLEAIFLQTPGPAAGEPFRAPLRVPGGAG